MSYSFDPVYARDRLVAELRHYAREQGFSKVVLGISGGKDSTVSAAICARALGPKNVYGIMLPDGNQKDISDSWRVCEALKIHTAIVNIGAVHEAVCKELNFADVSSSSFQIPVSEEAGINVPPRIRMTVLRYITQAIGARLVGTGNLSEIAVGYCTKDGDTSCDFSLLGGLTSVEVVRVGLTMDELPSELVLKTPSDGLCGMSDEEKLGVSYEDIHHYLRKDEQIDGDVALRIKAMHDKSEHKFVKPKVLFDPCWNAWEF